MRTAPHSPAPRPVYRPARKAEVCRRGAIPSGGVALVVAILALVGAGGPALGVTPDYIPVFQYQGEGVQTNTGTGDAIVGNFRDVSPGDLTFARLAVTVPVAGTKVFVLATATALAAGGRASGEWQICQCSVTTGCDDGGGTACTAVSNPVMMSLPWATAQVSGVAAGWLFEQNSLTMTYSLQHKKIAAFPAATTNTIRTGDTTITAAVLTTALNGQVLDTTQDAFLASDTYDDPTGTNQGSIVTYVPGFVKNSPALTALTSVGNTATATTASAHGLQPFDRVSISGVRSGSPLADDYPYNGDFVVLTVSNSGAGNGIDRFTYTTWFTPANPTADVSQATFFQNAWGLKWTKNGQKYNTLREGNASGQDYYIVPLNSTLPSYIRQGAEVAMQDVDKIGSTDHAVLNGFKPVAYDGVANQPPASWGVTLAANEFIYLIPKTNAADAELSAFPLVPPTVDVVRPLFRVNNYAHGGTPSLLGAPFLTKNNLPAGGTTGGFPNELQGSVTTAYTGATAQSIPIRDVFFSFNANVAQTARNPWQVAEFQVWFQAPGWAADRWEPVPENQIYYRTVESQLVIDGTPELYDYGVVHIVGRHRTDVNNPGLYKYRVKTATHPGGAGIRVTNASLTVLNLSWAGGYFKTIYADGRNYSDISANAIDWIDRDATKPDSITSSGTTATVTMPVSNYWATGDLVRIQGNTDTTPVSNSALNGVYEITKTGPRTFTYTFAGCSNCSGGPSSTMMATRSFATDSFPGITGGPPNYRKLLAMLSSYNYVTKSPGAAKSTMGVGISDVADVKTNEPFGNVSGGGGVVRVSKDYQGVVPTNCTQTGFTRGCEVGALSSTAIATNPLNTAPTPPFRGRLSGQLTGNDGALNPDLVFIELGSYGPTYGLPFDVRGSVIDGKTVVSWATAAELSTASFRLVRRVGQEWITVGPETLAALPPWPDGSLYEVEDGGASSGRTYEYGVFETETNGNQVFHGPFRVTIGPGSRLSQEEVRTRVFGVSGGMAPGFRRTLTPRATAPLARVALSTQDLPWARSAWKALVSEEGIYSIPLGSVGGQDAARNHGLSTAGQPVSFLNDGPNDRLLFYGVPLSTPYTDRNAYLLQPKQPRFMKEANGKSPAPAAQPDSFLHTKHFEKDAWAALGWIYDEMEDYWVWKVIQAETASTRWAELPFNVSLVDRAGDDASISIELYNLQDAPGVTDVQFQVSVNGTPVGGAEVNRRGPGTATVTFASSILKEGENLLRVDAVQGTGVPRSWWFIDSFDVTWPKRYEAEANVARVRAPGGQPSLTVSGFTRPDILVFDVSDPLDPVLLKANASRGKDQKYSVTFSAQGERRSTGMSEFIAVAGDQIRKASLQPLVDAGLKDRQKGVRHVVIAPSDLLHSAEGLASYRTAGGLPSLAVPLEAIWDEFGDGLPSAKAIRSFLLHASTSWRPAPAYVALAGKGTYDPKNIYGNNNCLIPTNFALSPTAGLAGTDTPFVVGTGMSIGRIPVTTGAALQYFNEKLAAHESAEPNRRATLLAGKLDPNAGDFAKGSSEIASAIPAGFEITWSNLDAKPFTQVRSDAISAFKRGDAIVSWVGHAANSRLANEGVLTVDDVPALVGGPRLSILGGATCYVNAFFSARYPSLGEMLVNRQGGGAIASWAPSDQSYNEVSVPMIKRFVGHVLSGEGGVEYRLGDAVRSALGPQSSESPREYLMWQLLGDPGTLVP